jgi:hypothetical protein
LIIRNFIIVVVLQFSVEREIRRRITGILMRRSIKNILFSVCATSVPALYKFIE